MNIVILGAGRVRESAAESLVGEHNDITVVDTDPQRLAALQDRLDLRGARIEAVAVVFMLLASAFRYT